MQLETLERELPELYDRMGLTKVHTRGHHKVLALPSANAVWEQLKSGVDLEVIRAHLLEREKIMRNMDEDPLRYCYRPQSWKDAVELLKTAKEICALGGNRAGKSHWAAWHCCRLMVEKPGAIVWAFSESSASSKRDAQEFIWHYLPKEWKALNGTRSETTYIARKEKTGFSEESFIAPNGSRCYFYNYEQQRMVIEGGQVDLWWGDELMPLDWVVTLRGRTIDRKGKGILTFTPINGFSPTVGEYLTGASVERWADCHALPDFKCWKGGAPGKVPYIMRCLNPTHRVIYFQPIQNPYIDYDNLLGTWAGQSRETILIRVHGVTAKASGNIFPRFGAHNIVEPEAIPKENVTDYHYVDFAWNRKWFMLWFRVWELKGKKRVYVIREWPDLETWGEWAITSNRPDGDRGPAQVTLGWGPFDYRDEILRIELAEGINPYIRKGDARSGNLSIMNEEGQTSIIEMLGGGDPAMDIYPVNATQGKYLITEGVNHVNQWLAYNEDKPIDVNNEPMLYVSSRCQNLITCIKLWTGGSGPNSDKAPSKDPCDLLRYAAIEEIEHVTQDAYNIKDGYEEDEQES